MLKTLAILVVMLLSGCVSQPRRMFGQVVASAQGVSVQQLLGNPKAYDGKEVRVIGVASFDFGFEGMSAIYTSNQDRLHNTFSYVGVASLDVGLKSDKRNFEKMNGQFVLVEGIFHMVAPDWSTVCIGKCWPTGYLSDVNRVQLRYPNRS